MINSRTLGVNHLGIRAADSNPSHLPSQHHWHFNLTLLLRPFSLALSSFFSLSQKACRRHTQYPCLILLFRVNLLKSALFNIGFPSASLLCSEKVRGLKACDFSARFTFESLLSSSRLCNYHMLT